MIEMLNDQPPFEWQRTREDGITPSIHHGLFATYRQSDRQLKAVIHARKRDRFASLAKKNGMGRHGEDHRGQLNGLYPDSESATGLPVKTIH